MNKLTHAEMLPAIRVANEAWRAEYLPRLRSIREQQITDRKRVTDLLEAAFGGAADEDRMLIERLTGFAITPTPNA